MEKKLVVAISYQNACSWSTKVDRSATTEEIVKVLLKMCHPAIVSPEGVIDEILIVEDGKAVEHFSELEEDF